MLSDNGGLVAALSIHCMMQLFLDAFGYWWNGGADILILYGEAVPGYFRIMVVWWRRYPYIV